MLGYEPEEMIARTVFDFLHPDDVEPTYGALAHATGATLPTFVNRYRHKDGSYRWLSWVAAPADQLIYATARDITHEREQAQALSAAQDALRQSQKMEAVGKLTGGIAHDEAGAQSDVDLFFEHPQGSLSLTGLMAVKETAFRILGRHTDIMTRRSLHPMLRDESEASARQVF